MEAQLEGVGGAHLEAAVGAQRQDDWKGQVDLREGWGGVGGRKGSQGDGSGMLRDLEAADSA